MRFFMIMAVFCIGIPSHAQTVLNWADLSEEISWELPAPENIFPGFEKAIFSLKMKSLEGEKVFLTGYFLVLDGKQSVYLLSKNPMASCFFCGNGGPETVVELNFAEKPSFRMDDLLSVEGTLRLNEDDPNASYYRIENANAFTLK
ncbi:MAG: DUF3299 domain-containing protein [Flavobacteriaceae bacterium]|nr:DUF3299 domain-containing protein [Flavobacteriaceae bacterium]